MPFVTVMVDGAARRHIAILNGRIVRDDFSESDHPRASNGQFGSGGTVHVITTHDSSTGETSFDHIGSDKQAAHEAHAEAEDAAEESGDTAEYHAPRAQGTGGERSDAVHIVHAADGAGGVDIHGVHLDYGAARDQATAASESEWDDNGPERGDLDRDRGEEDEAALAWNAEHADDNDGVKVKVDANGDVERDDDGNLQWEQDGEDVEPSEGHLAAFDDVFGEMYPADERAAYPGLEKANEHFTDEGRHEAVFRIHTHKAV